MSIFNRSQSFRLLLVFYLAGFASLNANPKADPNTHPTLDFPQALERVLRNHPALAEIEARAEAAEGQIQQAKRPPNPVLGAEAGNILGSGPMRGVQSMEFTLSLSQTIETAKKRQRRTALAQAQGDEIHWQIEATRQQIHAQVRAAFTNALLSQKSLQLRREQLQLAKRSAVQTERLVEAARSPEVEAARARLAVHQQRFNLQSAKRHYESAKTELASLWGDPHPEQAAFQVVGSITIDSNLPDFKTLSAQLRASAPLAGFEAQHRTREAALDLAQAQARPDFEVFAGGRFFNEADGEGAFLLGLEIPWPLFDKNKGNIRTAQALRLAAKRAEEQTERELRIRLNNAYQNLSQAHAEHQAVVQDLLPAAEETLARTQEGYQLGTFTQLAVLEARQTLFDLRESQLDALQRYALAQNQIHTLTHPANRSISNRSF
jgi:cobalt-zinc-cadmium efflux system outer membrane protein